MLFSETPPAEKRRRLHQAVHSGKLQRFPGAFSPLVAMLIEEQGWEGVYVSGSVVAADLGLPDIGLTSMSEVVLRGHQIARATELPTIIDIDTGFGEVLNVVRTVQELERLGLAGCHLEDQQNPKRCGHLDHKSLIETDAMVRKLRAAVQARHDPHFLIVARTDARAVEGLPRAIDRARAYVDAGADVIFPEALANEAEFELFRKNLDVPLLANMTEFGKSPLLTSQALQDLGYNLVIYPVTGLRLAMRAVEEGLASLATGGRQTSLLPRMQSRQRLYQLIRYAEYNAFDQHIYNFELD